MSTYKLIYDLNHCSVDVEMYVWCFLGKIVQVLKRKLCDCEWVLCVYVLVSVYFSASKKRIKNDGNKSCIKICGMLTFYKDHY